MSNTIDPAFVITGKVRLSYTHLFKPFSSRPGIEPKYGVTVLVPKSDIATKQRIDAAIRAAIEAGVAKAWKGIRPPVIAFPVHDGDGPRPSDGTPFRDECRGCWVFTASSKQPPQVVDINLNPITNQSDVYSGIYGRVSIRFFAYENSGKKGIGCGLNNVQKIEDGEPLGGGSTATEDFAGQPQYPQQYPQPQYGQPYQQQQAYATQPQYPQPQAPAYAPQPQYQQPPVPVYSPQFQQPVAPAYGTPQPQYPPQAQPINPITGAPSIGGVMGIEYPPQELPF